jgi:hypothetical protein
MTKEQTAYAAYTAACAAACAARAAACAAARDDYDAACAAARADYDAARAAAYDAARVACAAALADYEAARAACDAARAACDAACAAYTACAAYDAPANERKIMTTKISVTDVGTGSHATWDGEKLSVTEDGGCGMADVLARTRFSLPVEQVAEIVLRKWLRGYCGGVEAARENELTVEIKRGDESATEMA